MSKFHYMTITEFFILSLKGTDVAAYDSFTFQSTDSKTLDWLAASIEASSFKLTGIGAFPSGKKYTVAIDEVSSEESQKIKWWLLTQLCQRGWEPFAIEQAPHEREDESTSQAESFLSTQHAIHQRGTIHLRKREEEQA